MMPVTAAELSERRVAIGRTPVLARLRDRLLTFLTPLLQRPIYLPDQKALLSRDGGVCPDDGSRLAFDPFRPHRHHCSRCGRVLEGERHHRAWITRYQIWLSERAIHLALIGALDQDPALSRRAADILEAYAARYRDYPNRDNVLGPSRLFFSTYLESIWLCQVAIAASLLDAVPGIWQEPAVERVREMVAESAGLIGSFDEGWSNRQAWNNAALIAAGRWLDAGELVSAGLDGGHGMRAQLEQCVSGDGMWFEGENYHFFALRALLIAAEILRAGGVDLYNESPSGGALAALYVAPLKTVLPDLTLPARSDAPFGVSLLQPRFAELWEMGRVRTGQPAIEKILADLYASEPPAISHQPEDYGLFELAEQEHNRPPQRLSREGLGWKGLLWMLESDPTGAPGEWQAGSVLLADHGLAVLRHRERYLSMECGGRPGGHGHPDLLHVTLYWSAPWLVDFGTGSYVSASLQWYRSTLAHNAPGVSGRGQLSRLGWCVAFDDRGDWAWSQAQASGLLGPRSSAVRTLVAGPDWVLDVLDVETPAGIEVDLAMHLLGTFALPPGIDRLPGSLAPPATSEYETGYEALLASSSLSATPPQLLARQRGQELFVGLAPRAGERCHLASAVGPPNLDLAEGPPLDFLVRRARDSGRWVCVYARSPVALETRGSEIAVTRGDRTDIVRIADGDARIRTASGARVQLSGKRPAPIGAPPRAVRRAVMPSLILKEAPSVSTWLETVPGPAVLALGAIHYRRSEEAYDPTDFAARVAVFGAKSTLCFGVDVTTSPLVVRRPDAPDPELDNESADIHSDGVQCYVECDGWQGFLLLPDLDSSRVYIRPVKGTMADPARITAEWERTPTGYRMLAEFEVGRPIRRGDRFPVNVVINRMRPGRQRRAGQLALSGGGWVYLRGDRESPDAAIVAEMK